jgi:hypothetical protein
VLSASLAYLTVRTNIHIIIIPPHNLNKLSFIAEASQIIIRDATHVLPKLHISWSFEPVGKNIENVFKENRHVLTFKI